VEGIPAQGRCTSPDDDGIGIVVVERLTSLGSR